MQAVTEATIAQLQESEWFANVGKPDIGHEESETAIVVASWSEAMRHCLSNQWEELQHEAVNRYCEQLVVRSKERFQEWNSVIHELRPIVNEFVEEECRNTVVENSLPRSFVQSVSSDMLHACIEAEYSDVYPPGFFASLGYWYCTGRFPCGWKGDFPDGKMIIY